MSEETQLPLGEPTVALKSGGDSPLTVTEAVRSLKKARKEAHKAPEPKEPETPPAAPPEAAPAPEPEAPVAGEPDTADSPPESPSETTEAPEAEAELSPIEPPKSWTKEERERFKTLPRETQEYLADRESAREREFHQRQREAADRKKASDEQFAKAEQTRLQYEQLLPQVQASLQAQMASEFSDIKTWADVQRMAAEDFPRHARWQAAREQAAAVAREVQAAQARQAEATKNEWAEFSKKEDALFDEKSPELADKEKAKAFRERAQGVLREVGFEDKEIRELWEGKRGVSLRDHKVQLLVRDATNWRNAQAKAKLVTKAPIPPVQRPGTARPAGASAAAEIASLTKQLENAPRHKALQIATKITQLRRAQGGN